jgi:hypothetical protein
MHEPVLHSATLTLHDRQLVSPPTALEHHVPLVLELMVRLDNFLRSGLHLD